MPPTRPKNEKIIALFFLGLLGFNYPLIALFSKDSLTFGIPTLYLYLFFLWALFIGLIALLLEKKASNNSSKKDSSRTTHKNNSLPRY